MHAQNEGDVAPVKGRVCFPTLALISALMLPVCGPSLAASDAEVEELRRALIEVQAQNRELARRLNALESEAGQRRRQAAPQPAAPPARPASPAVPAPAPAVVGRAQPGVPIQQDIPIESRPQRTASPEELEGRVRELEISKAAQESATRSIIRDALTTLGTNINQYVALGGALDVRLGRFREFTGPWQEFVELNTAELDFDIKLNDWLYGSLIVSYDRGTSQLFQTVEGFSQGVDRINLDRATITVGDPQLFPIYIRGGGMSCTSAHRRALLGSTRSRLPARCRRMLSRRGRTSSASASPFRLRRSARCRHRSSSHRCNRC